MAKQNTKKRITENESDVLYDRYITPVAVFASALSQEDALQKQFPFFEEFYKSRLLHNHPDMVVEIVSRYAKWLSDIQPEHVHRMLNALWHRAQKEAALHTGEHPENFLNSANVDAMLLDKTEIPPLRKLGFLLYLTSAVMQLSLVFDQWRELSQSQLTKRLIDMHVCLERSDLYMVDMINKRQLTHKQIASKGGHKRAEGKFGKAKEYVRIRRQELLAKSSQISKRQIAKIIEKEAISNPAFKNVSQDGLYERLYYWVRKL